jgi:large subunit ribosomal protein L21
MKTTDIMTFDQYSIFQTGGKQYQAIPGKTLAVEKLDIKEGDSHSFDTVLFRKKSENEFDVGQPFVEGATVKVSVIKHQRAPKIIILKHKRRKNYKVKQGHRQPQTIIRIESI